MDGLKQITQWTAGGLHSESNPGENLPPKCGMVLKLTGTEFERVQPEEVGALDCSDEYVQPVTGPLIERSNLDADRISQIG
jgi:hypothetical protein